MVRSIHLVELFAMTNGIIGAHVLLYLMGDDIQALVESLEAKNVSCSPLEKERWGIKTTIRLPSGAEIGLYQPTHPTALNLQ